MTNINAITTKITFKNLLTIRSKIPLLYSINCPSFMFCLFKDTCAAIQEHYDSIQDLATLHFLVLFFSLYFPKYRWFQFAKKQRSHKTKIKTPKLSFPLPLVL